MAAQLARVPRWTEEEWKIFCKLNTFNPETIPEYTSGRLKPDCTTIQKAAEAGCLNFLKWCATNGYASEFSSTAAGYALKAGQKETFEWLITSGLITSYAESRPWLELWTVDAFALGVDPSIISIFNA